jgi:N12 class adenine-specific DNA methylase
VMGFEQFNRPDGFFDLAISNVPFGDFTIRDTKRPGYLIHDYFFIKALDMVRPGGMVAFITSDGTMDKIDTKARDAMLARADFVGAIRLPGGDKGAFAGNAGTQVTTDIIFLRPRAKGTPAQHIGNFRDLKTVQTPEGPAQINAYFAANPDMMLGEMRKIGTMYRADQKVLIGDVTDLDKKIAAAAKKMPKNAILPRGPQVERIAKQSAKIDAEASGTVKEGAFYLKGGKPYRKVNGVGQPTKLTAADAKKLPDFIVMRDIVNDLLRGQATGQKDANAQLRKNLNAAYDKFVKAHGPINQVVETVQQRTDRKTGETRSITIRKYPNFTPFAEDPDAFKTAAIESYDEATGKASKAAIFKEDIVGSYTPPEITGPTDAIAVSLNQTGKIDMPAIATQLNISEAQAIEAMGDLIYLDPAGDQWRTANEYLSGDVVTRLEEARAAAKTEPGKYARNVEALQAVQPTPLTRIDIRLQFGAPWIPADVYESFLTSIGGRGVKVRMNPMTKAVQVSDGVFDQSAQTRFGTDRAGVMEIANAALKQTTFKVYDKDANGDAVVNEKATQEVLQKINAIREEFIGIQDAGVEGWAFSDEARGDRLEALYNAALNRLVPTVYDGSHLALPGLAKTIIGRDGDPVAFDLRPHQKDAVWRVIQSGNALLDHVVGAGKTFTMIAAGMEQKRLGLIQRPMYAVPNHMLEQFSREFYQAYPNAKLLIATKDQMTKARRKEFAARVAADKWDGIIITHDAFGRIRMSDQAVADYLNTEVDRLQVAADAAREEEGAKSRTVKEIEKAKEKLETRIRDLMNVERKDEGVTFEELGVDYIVVDEAHLFKNLRTPTRHTRVKGIGKTASQRAEDLFMKIQTLEKNRPGRSVLFATGTPISNTMAEMYTMQRYLQNDTLREYGIDEFDAWAATFGSIETAMELSPNGRTMQEVTSFRSFINIPELVGLYSRVADVKTAEMLNLPRPTLKGGGIKVVEAEPSDAEEAYIASLVERADFLKKNPQPPTKGADNMLKIVSEGRKVAIDFRLIEPGAAMNPEGKVAKLVSNVARIHKEGKHPALAQLIFLDMGVPQKAGQSQAVVPARDDDAVDTVMDDETSEAVAVEDSEIYKTKFDLYNDIRDKLVADGIPRKEIAFIHEATDDVKKAALFRKVRSGEVRVLLGSTGKMGVGTNVQKLLYAMHHVDAPWKPAEVEQRDGRIIRQGNENAEVEMYRYITKRSFDSFMWQALERKSKFIGQIKAGARGIRSAEDIDDPLPEAATLKAAASGDPRIMEHAELTKEVRDLDNLARNHDRDIQRAKGNLNNTREELKRIEAQKSKLDADKKAVKDVSGDKFTVNLAFAPGRGPVTDRKTAGELVRKFLLDSGGNLWGSSPTTWTVGEIGGLTMKVEAQRRSDGIAVQPFVEGEGRYLSGQFILAEDGDPIGLMSRFERPLRDIPVMAERMPANIAAKKEEITRLEKQAEPKPFAREARRVEAKRRLIELEAALRPKDPAQDVRADGGETLMAARREDAAQGEAQSGDATIREESGRFAFDLTTSARFQQKRDAVFAELRKQLDGFGLPDVALRVSDRIGLFIDGIADGDLDGVFWKGIVEVALDARNATTTVRHEAVHAMKRMGLFTNSEWKILTDRAKREWMKTYRIASPDRYGAWTEAQQFEEAIAAAFENWKGGEPASGMIARLFQRMRDFIEALGNALRGNGFNTVEIIFADMEAGNVGRRGLEAANDADAPMAARKQKDDDTAGSFGRPRESIVQSLTNDNRSFLSNVHKATSWAAASESIDRWRYKFQDDVIDLRNVQREIEQMRGSQLKEADNAYLAYELYESRTGPRLEKLHEEIVAPLVHGIYERLDGKELSVTFEDGSSETVTGSDMLDLYRYALHAPERNARIAEINEEMPDGGSGMTDGDAEAVIDAVREAGLEPDLKALAKMAKRLTDFSRDVRVEAGLLSQEQADAWDRAYDNYVPLRGFAEMDPEIVTDRPNFGSGVNVRGPESKKARGRSSRAGDLLAFSIMQAQEALVRAGRNEVGVSLYNLAKANPNKEFWKVNKTRVKAYWNEDAQKVEYRADKTLNPTDDRLTVTAKIDGKEYRVTFNASNPTAVRIGEALRKQAGSEKLVRAIVGTLGQVNRYLSMVNTSINPEFVITNAIRDAQTAGINLQARGDGIAKAAAKHYFPALKAATKGAFGKGSGEWGGWYERFRMEGGQTHWNRVDDIPTIRKRLQRELNDIRNPLTARRAVNGIFNTIQNLNSGVENAARLASFRAAVEAGMTEAQAASIAKNVTVNFNRRGVYGPAANAMYLFFNASVQGSFTILSAMRAPKVRKIVGGIVAFGALNAVLNNLLGDDDEDGQSFYDKLPQYTKERNIILMLPGQGGKHLAFPMPYGYSAFHTMGRAAAEVAFGRSPLDAAGDIAAAIEGSFNPIGGSESILNFLAPTIVDPFIDLVTNRDFRGQPIKPEQPAFGPSVPESQLYWNSVSPISKTVAETLNELTGGDSVRPGAIDISPNALQYIYGVVTGAAGQTVRRAAELPMKFLDPESEIELNDIVFVRRAIGDKPGWVDKSMFYDRTNEIRQVESYLKRYQEQGLSAKARDLRQENISILRLSGLADDSRKTLSETRRERATLYRMRDEGRITAPAFKARIERLKERDDAAVLRFNKAWISSGRRE